MSNLNLLRSLYHCPLCHYHDQGTAWLSHTAQPEFAEEFVPLYTVSLPRSGDSVAFSLSSHLEQPEFAEVCIPLYTMSLPRPGDSETILPFSHLEQHKLAEGYIMILPRYGESGSHLEQHKLVEGFVPLHQHNA